ncbi:pentapeptide repeat-containing protein [Spirosoma validum]|uniref:Pentapeptide repeat-containing protein n=1 Tax=Spirosoma validum TaxID=2771355 RepID=A0A927GCC4_9BACT|nr:pentapeptide repeat-containing protein [Spirosoma validum]MBD2752617.1 pentapeptide repeat-containing protein [Spirosoma validum]
MADQALIDILKQGSQVWNRWWEDNNRPSVDLSEANLSRAQLSGIHLSGANLAGANLSEAYLQEAWLDSANLTGANLYMAMLEEVNFFQANLTGANFMAANLIEGFLNYANLTGTDFTCANLAVAKLNRAILEGTIFVEADLGSVNLACCELAGLNFAGANFMMAHLQGSDLTGAKLTGAQFYGAFLHDTNLTGADLTGADLTNAILVDATIEQTALTGCKIYGLSAWNLKGTPLDQSNLIITQNCDPTITVDDLEVAQFIHLLLNNKKVRSVIDTITAKTVLILGRFTEERKAVLDALRDEIRKHNYLPIVHDVAGPDNRDITETVSTLAHMAKFVIADITDAKSIPQELMAIVPNLPSVPVQPLLLASQNEYGMFEHFRRYPWVLNTYLYDNIDNLINSMEESIIQPIETWLANNR